MTGGTQGARRPSRAAADALVDLVSGVMGKEDGEDDGGWCPGISPHAAVPLKNRAQLEWLATFPGDGRVIEHTCGCVMTEYELMSFAGVYRIRRTTSRQDVPAVSYTHAWRRLAAYEQWRLLLAGQAR